jgi:hypothetical protein
MIILLAITFYLLYLRIKNTPKLLSKKMYMDYIQKDLLSIKEKMSAMDIEQRTVVLIISYIILALIVILEIIYYFAISKVVGNSLFLVLSAMQVATIIPNFFVALKIDFVNPDMNKIKFHRFYFLYNVILDYVYYIGAIIVIVGNFK